MRKNRKRENTINGMILRPLIVLGRLLTFLDKGKYYYYRKGVLVPNEVLNDVADVFGAKVKSLK